MFNQLNKKSTVFLVIFFFFTSITLAIFTAPIGKVLVGFLEDTKYLSCWSADCIAPYLAGFALMYVFWQFFLSLLILGNSKRTWLIVSILQIIFLLVLGWDKRVIVIDLYFIAVSVALSEIILLIKNKIVNQKKYLDKPSR